MEPKLVAHRGYALRYPENTLSAMEAAINAGARYVECDVQLSSDGFPVLMHDRTLERMCGVKMPVHELALADLRVLSCGERAKFGAKFAGEGIASLAGFVQLLRRHPHVTAFVEIKRIAIERFGRERILERVLPALDSALHQCVIISFSLEFLSATRAAHPLPLGAVFDTWSELDQKLVRELQLFAVAGAGGDSAFHEDFDFVPVLWLVLGQFFVRAGDQVVSALKLRLAEEDAAVGVDSGAEFQLQVEVVRELARRPHLSESLAGVHDDATVASGVATVAGDCVAIKGRAVGIVPAG